MMTSRAASTENVHSPWYPWVTPLSLALTARPSSTASTDYGVLDVGFVTNLSGEFVEVSLLSIY